MKVFVEETRWRETWPQQIQEKIPQLKFPCIHCLYNHLHDQSSHKQPSWHYLQLPSMVWPVLLELLHWPGTTASKHFLPKKNMKKMMISPGTRSKVQTRRKRTGQSYKVDTTTNFRKSSCVENSTDCGEKFLLFSCQKEGSQSSLEVCWTSRTWQ